MLVNHEVPKIFLEESKKFNNYEFCLPHLLDQDQDYLNHFLEAKKSGRFIIMDNSLHELGESYDSDRLLHWVDVIRPDVFIVPDVWEDMNKTLVNAKYWRQFKYPQEVDLMAVVQATSYLEASTCYQTLKDMGYKKIAFSYGAKYYRNFSFPDDGTKSKYEQLSSGRIQVINRLFKDKIILKSDYVHLLGCATPQEFEYYKDLPFIKSIDTSNPIMAAIEGLRYSYFGLDIKPKTDINSHFFMEKDEMYEKHLANINYNVKRFKLINRLN